MLRNRVIVAAVILLFLLLSLIYGRLIIQSDGLTYYALTRSALQDRDFNLVNENRELPKLHVSMNSTTKKIASNYSCGFAFLYLPFVWSARGLETIFPFLTTWKPYAQNIQIPITDSIGIFLGTICFALAAIFVAALLLRRRMQAEFGASILVPFLVFLGTPLAFHTFCSPSFVHMVDAFLITLAAYFVFDRDPTNQEHSRQKNLMLGFVLAFSILLRNNNVVLILSLVGGVLYYERSRGWKSSVHTCLEIFAGALPVLIIHALYNWNQYGKILATGYRMDFSKNALSEKLESLSRFYSILIDPSAGILFWAPVLLLSFVGLVIGVIQRRKEAILSLLSILIVILSIRFMKYVWSGASFGQRFILHLFPFYVIGLYQLFTLSRKTVATVAILGTLWCFLLMNLYLVIFPSPQLREALKVKKNLQTTPFDLLTMAKTRYDEIRESQPDSNVFSFWWESLGEPPYPTLIHILWKDDPQPGNDSNEEE